LSVALEYHRATNVPAGGTDEDESRTLETRPHPFKEYGDAERVPLNRSIAGPLLQDGAGIVRSRPAPWGTAHFRAYSSAGALYPIEAYVAASDGLYSFDALGRSLVRLGEGDPRRRLAEAAAAEELARAEAVVVLTGIHARTGWKYLERGYRHIWWDAGTMLANLLALAAAEGLAPRLYVGFVDADLNRLLGVDGVREYALALLSLDGPGRPVESAPLAASATPASAAEERRFPNAERLHEASSLADAEAVRDWRTAGGGGEEPRLPRDELARALRRRGSVRRYGADPLPRPELAELLAWSEAPSPADAPRVVRQAVSVAAVDGLSAGIYDARLGLVRSEDERQLRERAGFAAMEQDHPRLASVDVFQLAELDAVVGRLGDRGYRWAQLEAGIRAGRLQIGAVMRGWAAAASTFFDVEVSRLIATRESPLLMVAVGPRAPR
jgi:SagB-type dehydrogenase family enzyme